MSIYITGDTHIPIDISKLSTKRWKEQKKLTQNDSLIICGDFGGIWNDSPEDRYWLKWLDKKQFKVMFVDGNHENFNRLNEYPTEEFCGGKVHKVMPNIYHLMRGQVFNFNDTKIFTMGGAISSDKDYRKENINWWKQELPNEEEYKEAIKNLDKCDWKVNLIISHCTSNILQNTISDTYQNNKLTDFFDMLQSKLQYDKWYFGHYHIDCNLTLKDTAIYNKIILYNKS